MRSSKSRSRNKSNRNRSSGGSGGNVMNRVFDSSGPEGKVRGTPQQIIEKYNQLARDSQLSGDRVATENFQQHAEHYLRLLGVAQKEAEAKREAQERENQQRQADRDRDRERAQERARRQEQESNGGGTNNKNDGDLANAPQPDVVEAQGNDGGNDSGLVDTPESQPSTPRPKRSRKPRIERPAENDTDSAAQTPEEPAKADNPDAPKAAE